jgi:dTDP-4-dehydrorhamnose reductase
MKILVVGHKGKVGSALFRKGVIPLFCDITDPKSLDQALFPFDLEDVILINCTGIHVDECEKDYKKAFAVHVKGLVNLLDRVRGTVITISSDHVFNGKFYFPYYEFHACDPINLYGLSKYIAETSGRLTTNPNVRLITVRTSRLFDERYVTGIVTNLENGNEIDSPTFIKRSFLHIEHFADELLRFIELGMPVYEESKKRKLGRNLVHISGDGTWSFHHFNFLIADQFGLGDRQELLIKRSLPKDGYVPRPYRCGLDSKVWEPKFSAYDGIKLVYGNG